MNRSSARVTELFLLASIKAAGSATVYELLRDLDLTWGGLRPNLLRLEAREFLRRGERGRRGSRELSLTPAGEAAMAAGWQAAVEKVLAPEVDLATVVRAGHLAWLHNRPQAVAVLGSAAEARQRAASAYRDEELSAAADAAASFAWMHAFVRAHRWLAEAQILRDIRDRLQNLMERSAVGPQPGQEDSTTD